MYTREDDLINDFVKILENSITSPWGEVRIVKEFDYRSGRTDVVAVTGEGIIIAFEGKLSRWRQALHQAYRNTCFAHRSYIVIPEETSYRALRNYGIFSDLSIGICVMYDNATLEIIHDCAINEPLLPYLSGKLLELVKGESLYDDDD